MQLHELVEKALRAIGGAEQILSVNTFRARYFQEPGGLVVEVSRAAGGRVRIDYDTSGEVNSILVNGSVGMELVSGISRPLDEEEITQIRRDARLVPRNFLAHAHEYEITVAEENDGFRVFFPAEECLFVFDGQVALCRRRFDGRSGDTTEYRDYREVSGLLTPFFELITSERHDPIERRYELVEYNAALSEQTFSAPNR